MNKKPPELPDIEDATLRACLAPLMDAMGVGVETVAPLTQTFVPTGTFVPAGTFVPTGVFAPTGVVEMHVPGLQDGPPGSNDNPAPVAGPSVMGREAELSGLPGTLAEWRALADDDFDAFRVIEHFLSMTDAELETAAAEFPRQIGGTMGRISRIKQRLAARYDAATTVVTLLERALARAASKAETSAEPGPQAEQLAKRLPSRD